MPKITVAEALDKAEAELSGNVKEEVKEASTSSPEPSSKPEKVETKSQEDESKEPTTEPVEETETAPEVESERVEDPIDSAVKKIMSKPSSDGKATKEQLLDYLVDNLKSEIAGGGKKKEGPQDISEVNVNDPVAVQKYVDSRISHAVLAALQPIQHEMAMRSADQEFRKLFQDHPDAKGYGKQMAAIIDKFPELPLEYAYRIAKSDGLVKEGVKKAYDSMSKKKAANLSTSTVKSPVESPSKPKSVREAILMAMDETGATFSGE